MTDLQIPTGNVTLLFTDIQGSTQLWENHPEAMKLALAQHDSILRQTIEGHRGHVFKTVGDAFYAAFSNAPSALDAALEAQRALHAEEQRAVPGGPIIRVRMGLHSGPVEARDGDYFGPPLNRVARLMSAGHGGQTLLSSTAAELVRPALPAGVTLRDMGERRLKDLNRPEHIYQLLAPDLPEEFPPLRALDAFRTNLPAQLTSFVGREKEMNTVKGLIATHRLVTLTGPGGTGKTRLSLQVAADLLDAFPLGVWFVELAPLSDPAFIPQAVLTTFGLSEEPGRRSLDLLTEYLREKKILLILDNCEHVVEAAAMLAERLLEACPDLRLLVSSREALGIAGEMPFRVPSLSIPDVRRLPSFESFAEYEAVRLFLDRAHTVSPSFTISAANAPAVAQICARLDGIPLAIELAAARVKMLRVEQIAEHLDDRFRLLTGGSRTALPRQQTLRAMIDWSYDLLSEPERTLLQRLSVFAGGWTLEAAESVCSDQFSRNSGQYSVISNQSLNTDHRLLITDILDILTQLVNKSLVVVDSDDGPETRYRMLETIRQYGRDKLFESGYGQQVRDRHLQYFMQLSERAEPEFLRPNQAQWMNNLEAELDNLRTALEWSLEQDVQAGLRLASALRWFWATHDHVGDGVEHLAQLLAQPNAQARTAERAKALIAYSTIVNYIDDSPLPRQVAEEGLELYRELGDQNGEADALLTLASSFFFGDLPIAQTLLEQGTQLYESIGDKPGMARGYGIWGAVTGNQDYDRSKAAFEKSLQICREIGHLAGIGRNLLDLGLLVGSHGEYQQARAFLESALEINRPLGRVRTAETLIALGELSVREKRYEAASTYLEESLAIFRDNGQTIAVIWMQIRLSSLALKTGDLSKARRTYRESLQRFKEIDNVIGVVVALEGLAGVAAIQEQSEQTVQLIAWADVKREQLRDPRPIVEQQDVDHYLSLVHLDEATITVAQAAGQTMNLDQAYALGLEISHD